MTISAFLGVEGILYSLFLQSHPVR